MFLIHVLCTFAMLMLLTNGQSIKDSVICQSFCDCERGDPKWPDIDCSNKNINVLTALADETNFQSSENVSYSMKSLTMQNLQIKELNTTFATINVTHLDLSNNHLFSIANEVFKNLENMVSLDLSHNILQTLDADAFKGLRMDGSDYPLASIKILRLDYNEIHSLSSSVFQHIDRRLTHVYLSNNPFKVIDTSTLQALNSLAFLEVLDLSHTQISKLPEYFMHTPKFLSVFYLSGNQIDDVKSLGLEQSQALTEIYLDANPIVNLTIDNGFPTVDTLKIVHLSHMPELVEIGAHTLCNLINLEELYICDNIQLKKVHSEALTRIEVEVPIIQPIKKLHLRNNKLTHLELTLRWDKLEELDILENPLTCECENEWIVQELMPIYLTINKTEARKLRCAAPVEMENKYFYELYESKTVMRCLDAYGNRPERDGTILVCILLGLLLGIVLVLTCMYSYQRQWFGVFDNSPASFSRQFYGRTPHKDEEDLNAI